ncbi:MAG: MBL fold metallo-hydrolase [Elusimicrobiota bacterium]
MSVKVRFWGVRGSIPVPGPTTVRYGGNTACVEIRCGDQLFICDSGTGIRELGMSLMSEFKGRPLEGHILVGHTHWDHIQGFPFFVPAYVPKNRFKIHSVKSVGQDFEYIFQGQMGQNYFPVEIGDMAAQIEFEHTSGDIQLGETRIRTSFTNHPGVNIAFRFESGGRVVTYLSDHEGHRAFAGDNELTRRQDLEIENFCRGSDLLICDSQYTDEEYSYKRGWGHNRWRDALELGLASGARSLALFHHDPTRDDDAIDRIVAECRRIAQERSSGVDVFAAREGQTIDFP